MNPENINSIDENGDKKIGLDELKNALKTGFFDNEENLKQIENSLNNPQLNEEDKTFFDSLVLAINDEINAIKGGNISPEDIDLLNVWKILLGEDNEKVQELERLINNENFDLIDYNTELTPEENIERIQDELGIEIFDRELKNIKDLTLTETQLDNLKKIKGILTTVKYISDIRDMKDLTLTPEEIKNLKRIQDELGIKIFARDLKEVKDLILTPEQINNIKKIQDELGIRISAGELKEVKDLTKKEIKNLKRIQDELGIEISDWNLKEVKDLTPKEIKNLKMIKDALGIEILDWNLKEVKDLILTPEQINNIKRLQDELGIRIGAGDLKEVKDLILTKAQLDNLKKIKEGWGIDITGIELKNIKIIQDELGIDISWGIPKIKDLTLTPEEINNLKRIQDELGIKIPVGDLKEVKDLTPEQINNIKRIQDELGISISRNLKELKDLTLTPEQINNIKRIQDELGIIILARNLKELKDLTLTPEQINNIKRIQDELGMLHMPAIFIRELKDATPEEIHNLKRIQDELGIKIANLKKLNDLITLTPEQINNLKRIQDELGISIEVWELKEVKDLTLTPKEINSIKRIQDELGIEIFAIDLKEVKDLTLTPEEINNVKRIQDELGIEILARDLKEVINVSAEKIEKMKSLKKEFGIEFSLDDLNYIDLKECEKILRINSENFYERYDYSEEEIQLHHHYKRGRIIESIQKYVQSVISENRNIEAAEIIEKIRSDLVTLPAKEKFYLISGISKVVNRFNTVREYLKFDGVYKTPKELLCVMRGITDPDIIKEITDDITVIPHGTGMMFFVGDEKSYQIIYDMSLRDSGRRSGGFNIGECAIEGLEGTLSFVNGKNPGENTEEYTYGTIWHEGQHNWNSYFMSDKDSSNPLIRGKDEITAYLRDGRDIDVIKEYLTQPESEGGLYQYGLIGEKWENHKRQIEELLGYVHVLLELTNHNIGLTRENVISMLSDTPANERKLLYENFRKSIKFYDIGLWLDEYLGVKNIENNGGNNNLLEDSNKELGGLGYNENTLEFNMEDFRWTGNATKENLENEIQNAGSLDELKHILSDPKYSHIGRGPNNVGGIEISVMIDNVVEGNMKITFIPTEIRSHVQRFIN